ncbi:MAG: NAD(P)H-hydrate dehydratase [Spirochaetales bacterium]|nr:NAD(P)H-hydrate dehydratase [Spirochaetales bacterium]MCF7939134.1 NAD(P)H-hydrate dehydratase [Spirochaetales bacterium]
MRMVRSDEMAAIDAAAQKDYHIPDILLMENAGIMLSRAMQERMQDICTGDPAGCCITVAAGRGNNAGDAQVIARRLHLEGFHRITVVFTSMKLKGNAELHASIDRELGLPQAALDENPEAVEEFLRHADLIIDGVSGTGIQGELRGASLRLVEMINAARAPVYAVDVPSGVGDSYRTGYRAVQAARTFTVGLPKRCLYLPAARTSCGKIEVVPIGFPPALLRASEEQASNEKKGMELIEHSDLDRLLPVLEPDSYKNRRGHLAVFAGSVGTHGASLLAARAASRGRSGLVTLYADTDLYPLLAPALSSVMLHPLAAEEIPDLRSYSAFAAGPGWGAAPHRDKLLSALIASGHKGVIDADGLTVLSRLTGKEGRNGMEDENPAIDMEGRIVLTPHPGEFSRFSGMPVQDILAAPDEAVGRFAARFHAVVVLKGHVTWIGDPSGSVAVYDGMEPAMATGGTGDVLTGVIGSLLASGLEAPDAARAGVLIHGRAGKRLAVERHGTFASEELIGRLEYAP